MILGPGLAVGVGPGVGVGGAGDAVGDGEGVGVGAGDEWPHKLTSTNSSGRMKTRMAGTAQW
jgi:hypothetical protein